MGKPEVPEGLEYTLRKTRRRLESLEQWGKEPEREPEVGLGVEPGVEPEVAPIDVDMTIQ